MQTLLEVEIDVASDPNFALSDLTASVKNKKPVDQIL